MLLRLQAEAESAQKVGRRGRGRELQDRGVFDYSPNALIEPSVSLVSLDHEQDVDTVTRPAGIWHH